MGSMTARTMSSVLVDESSGPGEGMSILGCSAAGAAIVVRDAAGTAGKFGTVVGAGGTAVCAGPTVEGACSCTALRAGAMIAQRAAPVSV